MKIKELHLRNIASIEKADIDFEKDLKDAVTGNAASIFLIAGDTGAGKSVLLDGISMALYKKTPRTTDVENVKKNEFTNALGESVSINDIEQYTRLGISEKDECYSEVIFEGNDGKEYHAKLELGLYKSNKKDAAGKYLLKHSNPKWTYKKEGGDWANVDARSGGPILDAIGLTFEQFGRMAMLAQGQFASFLTGEKKERESILEKLTNTEIFSQYGAAISNIHKRTEEAKNSAETALNTEAGHTLAPEKLTELNTQLSDLNEEKKKLDTDQKAENDKLDAVKAIESNINTQKEVQQKINELNATIGSKEFKEKKTLVEDWDSTEAQRKALGDKEAAIKKRDAAKEELVNAKDKFLILIADYADRQAQMEKDQNALDPINKDLEEEAGQDILYTDANAIVEQLKQYKNTCDKLAKAQRSIKEEQDKTDGLKQTENICSNKAKEAQDNVNAKQKDIDDLNQQRNALNPATLNQDVATHSNRKNALEKLQTRINVNEKNRRDNETLKGNLHKESETLEQEKSDCDSKNIKYEEAKKKEEETKSLFTTMNTSLSDALSDLRRHLAADHADICPLCGQKLSTEHLQQDFKNLLTPLQEKEKSAKRALDEAKKLFDAANDQYTKHKANIDANQNVYDKVKEAIEKEDANIATEAQNLKLNATKKLAPQISSAIKAEEDTLNELKKKQEEAESLVKRINQLTKDKQPLDTALQTANSELQKAKNAVEQNRNNIVNYQNTEEQEKEDKEKQAEALKTALGDNFPTWQDNPEDAGEQLKGKAKTYCDKKRKAQELQTGINTAKLLLDTLKDEKKNILTTHADWDTAVEPKPLPTNNINKEWSNLKANILLQDKAIDESTQKIEASDNILNSYYASTGKAEDSLRKICKAESQIPSTRNYINKTESDLNAKKETANNCASNIQKQLENLGVTKLEEIPERKSLEEKLSELRQHLVINAEKAGTIKTQLKENQLNVEKLQKAQKALDAAKQVFEKWDRLNKVFGGTKFRTLVQTYILLPLLNNANIYLQKITDRYTLTCSKENEQLSILVLDQYNKGQVRSITVLSGGEKFMISLALSLALSSLNRQDMKVDILFIDEGFGTLDENNLNSVMSTLEKLQEIAGESNRRVGIISHREELVERIPVKIQVKKKGEGRSLVEISNN